MFANLIAKVVMKALNQAVGEITRQVTRVQTEVVDQMTSHVTTGFDDMWRGEDADQFKEKVLKIMIPDTSSIVSFGGLFTKGIMEAAQKMQGADKAASGILGDLGGVFGKIF